MILSELWASFIVLGFLLPAQLLNSQDLTCNSDDLRALEAFIDVLESPISGWNASSSPNCCNWLGITCNSSAALGLDDSTNSGRVVKLEVGKSRLAGRVSESLGSLDQLTTLNLSRNFLHGSIPISLFHLPNLEILDLSNNEFNGVVPRSINLPSLQVFDLSENSLRGSIPVEICSNSTRIRFFYVAVNHFEGNLPPGLGDCSLLEHLCLGTNFITGGLPDDLFRLSKLNLLAIQDNRLSGELSSRIGNLSNLVRLDLSLNGFSGNLPDMFHSLGKLLYFSGQSNKFSGLIPKSLANSPGIVSISLRNNSLVGPIDLNCSAMTSLVSLDLGSNPFNGLIPDNLPLCRRLRTINLARNNFTGQIPESFRNFPSLTFLSFSNSSIVNLSNALQTLQHCRNLTTLVLTMNFRGEELPSDDTLEFRSLRALVIPNCRLTGSIPRWLSRSTKLQLLDLSWNRLGGSIPSWFGNLGFLFYLDLSNNSFTGEIPRSLTRLQSLVSGNNLPAEPSLELPFYVRRNGNGSYLQYNQIWSFPPTIELGNNFLNGSILPEFGNLRRLHVLDLKCNNLTGTISSNLSGMISIETLDLSYNDLTGSIPRSLVNLSFLSRFSVAYNRLSGEIPAGGQFLTFMNSSFEGNLGLCGEHASPCHRTDPDLIPVRQSRRHRGPIIGMAVGIGLGTAFLLSLMFFIVLRRITRKRVDLGKETGPGPDSNSFGQLGSKLVVFFENNGHDQQLCLDELLECTNNFDQANIIGCGGFGLVYKATLPDGTHVAIKRLSGEFGEMEREFQAEVEALSKAQHPNLVLLQGYCMYKNDRLLIYSYMENGSLDYWLHEKPDGPASLDWDTRLRIAQGASKGLAYLHESCEPRILHRDIKTSNILLDENFEAHLADFGLARLILPYDTHVTTDLVGTLGYIPPEYVQASVATYKGDVYSFGVVLLELLTGKRPMDICKPKGSRDLISWVIQMKKEKRETEVFDPFVYDKEHAEEMLWVLDIACLCLSECPKIRPSTRQIVSSLDKLNVDV